MDHSYFFAYKWRIVSKSSRFAMEGSHLRLKRMLRNSEGSSLLPGRLGVQVVVDNHTIDDSLWSHGWEATKRAHNRQGPMSVQRYACWTRRRLLTDMQHLQTLERWCRCRKKETNMRIQHDPRAFLPAAKVHARVHLGGVPRVLGLMRECTRVKFV